ncbi:MAG: hypothetical protein AAFU71_08340 [Cyanobacteria bacterium J06632_22]
MAQLNLPNWRQLLIPGLEHIDTAGLDAETLWQHAQTLLPKKPSKDQSPKAQPLKAQPEQQTQPSLAQSCR